MLVQLALKSTPKNFRTNFRIFMKFGTNIMSLVDIRPLYIESPEISNTNTAAMQTSQAQLTLALLNVGS